MKGERDTVAWLWRVPRIFGPATRVLKVNSLILEDGVAEITVGGSYLFKEGFLFQIGGIENFTDPFPDGSAADFSFFVTLGVQI